MGPVFSILGKRPVVLLLVVVLGAPGCGDTAAPRDGGEGAVRSPEPKEAPLPAPLEIPVDAPVVVFLGDSLSAGMHLAAHEAFPAVLQRRLSRRDLPFRLVNAGVSGDTTAGGLARVGWLLEQDPDLVVVELGANDGFRGIPLEKTEANVREILARVRAHGAKALLLGMKLPPNYGADHAQGFEALYARIAKDTGVAFVPFFLEGVAGIPDLNLPDGIHPTAEGHRRVAAGLEETLVRLLAPSGS